MTFLSLCPRCRIVPMLRIGDERICPVCGTRTPAAPQADCGCGA